MKKRQFKEILKFGEGAMVELNAIIHRDYFEIGARVMVEIFDDRVEISNPGVLNKNILSQREAKNSWHI